MPDTDHRQNSFELEFLSSTLKTISILCIMMEIDL